MTDSLSPADRAQLREKALNADQESSGPWHLAISTYDDDDLANIEAGSRDVADNVPNVTAEFIAAASPQVVLGLLEELELAHGAMVAQDEREARAGDVCGISRAEHGCDWPEAVAEAMVVLREQLAALEAEKAQAQATKRKPEDPR